LNFGLSLAVEMIICKYTPVSKSRLKNTKLLERWLADVPDNWAQIVAARAALRGLPTLHQLRPSLLGDYALRIFRALIISWSQHVGIQESIRIVSSSFAFQSINVVDLLKGDLSDQLRSVAYAAAFSAGTLKPQRLASDVIDSTLLTVEHACLARDDADIIDSVQNDCDWLVHFAKNHAGSTALAGISLWQGHPQDPWIKDWWRLEGRLLAIDQNYSVWNNWYERRIWGNARAFDIPGDKGRVEDKKILRRLAEATDEDFWGKGHEYVNATLKGWLDEARERVAPPPKEADTLSYGRGAYGQGPYGAPHEEIVLPPQESGAITYGVNVEGKLDRLAHSDQAKLRDTLDQRRAYAALRQSALDLRSENEQRLGVRLCRALDRFLASLPEQFEEAETNPIWSDATTLRSLNYAHKVAAKSLDPDDAQLESVAAALLDGMLKHYNVFAFGDDGLRAKDEQSISAQEQADAMAEASAGTPIFKAMEDTPNILSPVVQDDLMADLLSEQLPDAEPYDAQMLKQSNGTRRNLFAALIGGSLLPNIAGGAAWDGIKVTATFVGGVEYAPLLQFIASNAPVLQHYVAIAFPSFEHLPSLIENLKLLWTKRSN
jgi:hypothetical protein